MHTLIRKRKGKGRSKGTYWSQKKRGNGREIKPTNVGAKEKAGKKPRKVLEPKKERIRGYIL